MIIIKKKNVLHELAVSLFLMLAHSPNVTASPLVQRVRDRAEDALQAAFHYTGVIGDKDVSAFLTAKPLKFSIDCGRDIIKGEPWRTPDQRTVDEIRRYAGEKSEADGSLQGCIRAYQERPPALPYRLVTDTPTRRGCREHGQQLSCPR